jgi:hypothetical protein
MALFKNLSTFEKDEYKRKFVSCAFFAALAAAFLLLLALVLKPQPALPPPPAHYSPLEIEVAGKIAIPPELHPLKLEKGGYYLEGLRLTLELPEIPYTLERRDRGLACGPDGAFVLAVKGLMTSRKPGVLNARLTMKGYEPCYTKGISLHPMPCRITIPTMALMKVHQRSPARGRLQ